MNCICVGSKSVAFQEKKGPRVATGALNTEPWGPNLMSIMVQVYSNLNASFHCISLGPVIPLSICSVFRICHRRPVMSLPGGFALKNSLKALPLFLSNNTGIPSKTLWQINFYLLWRSSGEKKKKEAKLSKLISPVIRYTDIMHPLNGQNTTPVVFLPKYIISV